MHHAAFLVQEIERIQIVAVVAPCLCNGVIAGMVDDHEIKMPAQIDTGFIGGVEDEKDYLLIRRGAVCFLTWPQNAGKRYQQTSMT